MAIPPGMVPTLNQITALVSVVLIDVVLAGDNAIVVGMAASGLPAEQRRRAIVIGIGAATVLRILFAAIALQLLEIIGLALAGGVLLLWVAWKLFRELRHAQSVRRIGRDEASSPAVHKTVRQAVTNIVVADISMSLDNVLAVAGVARTQAEPWVLFLGLILSVALMGIAANFVARLLARRPWLAWLGLGIITAVALRMIWAGGGEVLAHAGGG
ncbi:MAG TPA: YjbE family putative metal transport protein [Stellaceae bacterium]|jgi:YjbE family integral membrane protein|nr:YjbE family putative metal transport protein [Stellaceae bacterium]